MAGLTVNGHPYDTQSASMSYRDVVALFLSLAHRHADRLAHLDISFKRSDGTTGVLPEETSVSVEDGMAFRIHPRRDKRRAQPRRVHRPDLDALRARLPRGVRE